MTQLSREACIELGVSVPTAPLIGWATEQLAAAKVQEQRLQHRGVRNPFLTEIKTLIDKVEELQTALGKEKTTLPAEVTQAQRTRDEAYAHWQEAKQIVKTEFGTRPEIQAKFHFGVRTGRLIANLRREMEHDLALLREHSADLRWLGVDEAFLTAGDVLISKLKDAQTNIETATKRFPSQFADQCSEKGKLYELTRKLVRIGKLEFQHEPEQAAVFNYDLLRKELRAGSEVRANKTAKASTR
jgi:hypothetical protein